eukprot:g7551.t1
MAASALSRAANVLSLILCAVTLCSAIRSTELPRNDATKWLSRKIIPPVGKQRKYTVLSLDGGGLRGIITTEILTKLENAIKLYIVNNQSVVIYKPLTTVSQFEIDIADYFKTIAGVSAGSWIATYLASKGGNGACEKVFADRSVIKEFGDIRCGSVEGLRVYFLRYGNLIYPPAVIPISPYPRFGFIPVGFRVPGLNMPTFSHSGLETLLEMYLGDTILLNTKSTLFVHAYDLIRRATVLFISDKDAEVPATYTYIFSNKQEDRYVGKNTTTWASTVKSLPNKHYRLRDITRASSAAPMVHAAKQFSAINDQSCAFYCVDGAMMANNPSFQTVIFLAKSKTRPITDLAILSIGMGIAAGRLRSHGSDGFLQWFRNFDFLSVVMDGGSELIQAQLDIFFYKTLGPVVENNQYLRIQTTYDTSTPEGRALAVMTDYTSIKMLQKIGQRTAEKFKTSIGTFAKTFLFGDALEEESPPKAPAPM